MSAKCDPQPSDDRARPTTAAPLQNVPAKFIGWPLAVRRLALGSLLSLVTALCGCPPGPPHDGDEMCAVPLNNIKSVRLLPEKGLVIPRGGTAKTVTVGVSAPGAQPANVAFCVGILAGELPTNRATDHKLGGTVLFGDGTGRFEGSFDVRCTTDGLLEAFAANESGQFGWQPINTHENGLYALTLPAGLFSPASNTIHLKCE
jgi:hypothetical protein